MYGRLIALVGVLASAALPGCITKGECNCAPCLLDEPGVWLLVTDSGTGQPVDGVFADGFTCWLRFGPTGATTCHAAFRAEADEYDVTVGAPAYGPATFHVVEPAVQTPPPSDSCCGSCPVTVSIPVALNPI